MALAGRTLRRKRFLRSQSNLLNALIVSSIESNSFAISVEGIFGNCAILDELFEFAKLPRLMPASVYRAGEKTKDNKYTYFQI